VESDDEDPLDVSRSLRYHLEETDMKRFETLEEYIHKSNMETFYKITGMAPPPPDELLPENDPGDLDSDYTPKEHQKANGKTEDQLAKKRIDK